MKNLQAREGFKNRHIDGLPQEKCLMKVIQRDYQGEQEFTCQWHPFNPLEYTLKNYPAPGYLGTVKVIEDPFIGIGFHAWEQNDSEFVYYQVL